MKDLQGFQKKFLRGAAHKQQPVVMVGHKGFTKALVQSTDAALNTHELVKVKFIDFKEKTQKAEIASDLAGATASQLVGIIGHVAIFYRPNSDPDKRKIILPSREG